MWNRGDQGNQMKEEDIKLISIDTSQLITSLLVYKLASKILNPQELNSVINGGSDTIIHELSNHMDKKAVEKISKDTAENIKDLIIKMRQS